MLSESARGLFAVVENNNNNVHYYDNIEIEEPRFEEQRFTGITLRREQQKINLIRAIKFIDYIVQFEMILLFTERNNGSGKMTKNINQLEMTD